MGSKPRQKEIDMIDNIEWLFAPVLAAIVGCYGWIAKHVGDRKIHQEPKGVTADVCKERTKRIEEKIEMHHTQAVERQDEIKKDVGVVCADIKKIMKYMRIQE